MLHRIVSFVKASALMSCIYATAMLQFKTLFGRLAQLVRAHPSHG